MDFKGAEILVTIFRFLQKKNCVQVCDTGCGASGSILFLRVEDLSEELDFAYLGVNQHQFNWWVLRFAGGWNLK